MKNFYPDFKFSSKILKEISFRLFGCVFVLVTGTSLLNAQPFQKELPSSAFYTLKKLPSGNLVASGKNPSSEQVVTGLFSQDGNLISSKVIKSGSGTLLFDPATAFNQMIVDGDSLVFNVYSSSSTNGVNNMLLKTDSLGNASWGKAYKNDSAHLTPRGGSGGLIRNSNGDYVVASWSHSHVNGSLDYGGHIQLNKPDGSVVWSNHYYTGFIFLHAVTESADKSYTFIGGTSNPLVINTNDAGAIQWASTYRVGTVANELISIVSLPDNSKVIFGSHIEPGVTTSRNGYVLKVAADGTVVWAKSYKFGARLDYFYNGKIAADGGFIVSGKTNSLGAGNDDGLVVKLDANGNVQWAKVIGSEGAESLNDIEETADFIYGIGTTGTSGWYVATSKTAGSLSCGEIAVTPVVTDETALVVRTARTYVPYSYATISGDNLTTDNYNIVPELMCEIATPLNWLSFTAEAKNSYIQLQWATENEVNTSSFNVERSADGTTWEKIGLTPAKGNNKNQYYFTDNAPLAGQALYRIKQLDKDGNYAYSKTEVINSLSANSIKLYPNPATGSHVLLQSTTNIESIRVLNATGTVLISKNAVNNTIYNVPVSGLNAGVYLVKILFKDGSSEVKSFIKQ